MNAQQQNLRQGAAPRAEGKFFGIPLGDFGLFTSLLMALAVGFLSQFFLFTFLAIVGIMIYNGMGHRVDYAKLQVHLLPRRLRRSGDQPHLFWHAVAAPQVFERLRKFALMALITIALDPSQPGSLENAPAPEQARAWCKQLESGDILYFRETPIRIDQDLSFLLGQQQTGSTLHKNIAYKPNIDRVSGLDAGAGAPS